MSRPGDAAEKPGPFRQTGRARSLYRSAPAWPPLLAGSSNPMNLADLRTMPSPASPAPPAGASATPTLGDVVARIAAEVSSPLTAALDRVLALTSSGRIARRDLHSLRNEIAGARRVGLQGQQIARFASGEVRQSLERLDLAQLLRGVLDEQARLSPVSAMNAPAVLGAAEVMGDASLVHALLQAAADWSAAQACEAVSWQLDVKPWPVHARIVCQFARQPADRAAATAEMPDGPQQASMDTLDWLLLQYTAHIAGVSVQRSGGPSHCRLTLEFQRTVNVTLEGASAVDLAAHSSAASSIAGSQVLVLAAQRETRQALRDALQGQDLLVDHVSTVTAAALYCEDGTPQILLYESAFDGEALRGLRQHLSAQVSAAVLIELQPSGQHCEIGDGTADSVTRLGVDGLRQTLVSVLTLEAARRHQR